MEFVKYQPYTTRSRASRTSSGSVSGAINKMTLRSTSSRIGSTDDDVIVHEKTVFHKSSICGGGSFSPGLGDFESIFEDLKPKDKAPMQQVVEEIQPESVDEEEAGVNGPLAVTLTHVTTGSSVGGSTYVNLDGDVTLVMWKLGTVNGSGQAYVFAKDLVGGGYEYVISNGSGFGLEYSTDAYSNPLTIDIDTDDLSKDPRVFVLYASSLNSDNEAYLFPYGSFSSLSDSVKVENSELVVAPHSATTSALFRLD